MENNNDLIGVSEAAKILGASQNTVRRLADSGKLKCYRIADNSYRKFSREDVLEYRESSFVIDTSKSTLNPSQLSLFDDLDVKSSKS